MAEYKFTAEYRKSGSTGTSICCADDINDLIKILCSRGYAITALAAMDIARWSRTETKKYYGRNLMIRRGPLEMTEYTSF